MDNLLFDIEPQEIRQERCKTCNYFDWLEYESGKKFFYCNLFKSNRTQNGKMKIKANKVACTAYEPNILKTRHNG